MHRAESVAPPPPYAWDFDAPEAAGRFFSRAARLVDFIDKWVGSTVKKF